MTTPQRNDRGERLPAHRPSPLEITSNGSGGDREFKPLPASLHFLTSPRCRPTLTRANDRSHWLSVDATLSIAFRSVRLPRYPFLPPSLNPRSSPHVTHVPSLLSPNYQPPSALRSGTKPVRGRNRRSALLQFSPGFSPRLSAHSPSSPLLPRYSPSLPVESPVSFFRFGNEKSTLSENLDDVCLDVSFMDVELKPRGWLSWPMVRGWVLVSPLTILKIQTSLPASASLIFLGILAITWVCYLCVPQLGFGGPRPPDVTPVWHPEIQVDAATFVGTSYGRVDGFLGIPFAKPPWVPIFRANSQSLDLTCQQNRRSPIPPPRTIWSVFR